MKKSNQYKSFATGLLVTVILLLQTNSAHAQFDRSLNFLTDVPQSRNVNPGFIPDHRLYIGVPLLSSVKTGFENSINYEDVILKRGDSLILDRDHILNNFDSKTNVNISTIGELLSFGFKENNNYFHFRIADIVETNIVINREFLRFFLYGNGSPEFLGQNVDIGGEIFNVNYYREYSLGYARKISDKLNLGVNLKYLQGIANITTEKTGLFLSTDPEDFTLNVQTDIEINMSLPGIDNTNIEAGDFLPNGKNSGFAFDLGGQYTINNDFTAFASLLNVGSIKWTENLKNFKTKNPDKTFVYEGFDLGEYFEDNTFDNDRVESVIDSIIDEFGIDETADAYKSKLAPMLNLGGRYHLTAKDEFSLLFRNQFIRSANWTTVSAAYTRDFGKGIDFMVSNTFFKQSFFNPGVGLSAALGPVQFYLISENIVAPLMLNNSNIFLLRFGINLIFKDKISELPVEKNETPETSNILKK